MPERVTVYVPDNGIVYVASSWLPFVVKLAICSLLLLNIFHVYSTSFMPCWLIFGRQYMSSPAVLHAKYTVGFGSGIIILTFSLSLVCILFTSNVTLYDLPYLLNSWLTIFTSVVSSALSSKSQLYVSDAPLVAAAGVKKVYNNALSILAEARIVLFIISDEESLLLPLPSLLLPPPEPPSVILPLLPLLFELVSEHPAANIMAVIVIIINLYNLLIIYLHN